MREGGKERGREGGKERGREERREGGKEIGSRDYLTFFGSLSSGLLAYITAHQ